ncbi:PREDICTED: tetraspanin-9 [Nicrophorus vespilloides]|uniref:Tetraspanin n=1 Tax=Nicrophorus vespilloides TaxID=110193 RepID=A0ABM1MMX2_NICVS|nr:PREDICTED: tetraspanin-9 [Nicrophorus vespilloides]
MTKSGYTCVRHIFCWLNVILWITGCGILGVGIWLRISYEGYTNLLPQYALLSADSLAIVVGAIGVVLAFFGCCGSWFQSRCMLITYFALVVFIFMSEFLMGSVAFVFREGIGHVLKEELTNGLKHHYNITAHGPNSLVTIWDHLQSEFHCCGIRDYVDWYLIDAWPDQKWVPDSCCLPGAEHSVFAGDHCGQSGNQDLWYAKGCSDQIHMWFMQRLHIIGIVGLVVAFIQLFGLICSMLLFCTVKHKRTSHSYKSYDTN